ncbi:hypothetical protein BD779DRAFT_1673250 [Infundibulicybe gibba]|nr:hypothetical protein BD779DRAFT_1673250 [Infundibulicybe gibba]
MSGLLSLPNELITQIADQLETQKLFRGTCRRMDLILSPRVLFRLTIDINKESIDRGISQLEALTSGSIRAAQFVRTVDIRHLAPNCDPNQAFRSEYGLWGVPAQTTEQQVEWAYSKMRELLPAALATLAGAQTINWIMNDKNPDWASAIVCEFLDTLSGLQALRLTGSGPKPQIHLNHISNLTKLTVRGGLGDLVSEIIGSSSGLSHLDLEYPDEVFGEWVPTFHKLLSKVPANRPLRLHHLRIHGYCVRFDHQTLPHLRQLKSLDLGPVLWIGDDERPLCTPSELAKSDKFASSFSDIWGVIRREVLPIEEVITLIDDLVLDHLAAMNGFQKLAINQAVSRTNNNPPYTWAHVSTPSDAENEMLARKFFVQVLPRHCKTLISFSISSLFDSHWFLGSHSVGSLLECTQLTELAIVVGFHWDVQERIPGGVLEEALHMAAQFPNLRQLELVASHVWPEHAPTRPRIKAEAIVASIISFGPVDPDIHPPVLRYGHRWFGPRRGSDGIIRYTPEYPISSRAE